MRRALIALVIVLALAVAGLYAMGLGWLGDHEGPGTIEGSVIPAAALGTRTAAQRAAAEELGVDEPKQILFGDLHVHTTFSADAFMRSLPISNGEGAHPPADACDFARFCSALDFWSINDHAEGLTPRHWQETVESIRRCDAVAGDAKNPDVVPFLGWEWTNVGSLPENHFGHKNVVLRHLDDARIPARPIAARGLTGGAFAGPDPWRRAALILLGGGAPRMHDLAVYLQERTENVDCPDGVPVRELPADCIEWTSTPAELFAKLDDWGHESIVIPHGTSWGMYTPPGSSWDKQLVGSMHDPKRQTLIEVFSGHGNSEEYRDWRALRFDAEGRPLCPEVSEGYLPPCRRAGEIILARCQAAGLGDEECEKRAEEARTLAAQARGQAHLTIAGEAPEEWLDAGQCNDCFQPGMNHRPGGSVQYISALGNFDGSSPRHFRMGFIASSDNHTARAGTGYKEFARISMTESSNGGSLLARIGSGEEPEPRAKPFDLETTELSGFQLVEFERQQSFFLTGGLVAAHATGRSRDAIWEALKRREVYGTSGPRILLWFDLLGPGGTELPMGSSVATNAAPVFRVRAVGSFEQQQGCPEYATSGLSPQRLEALCRGECYHPSDRRRPISRIEIVRIRPQQSPAEPIAPLIEDPWRVYGCKPDTAGCTVTFQDPEFPTGARDALYYARAIEVPSNAVNAGNLRCKRDESGRCTEVNRCGTPDTVGDDCLSKTEERAWSSPIFVQY